MGAAPALRACRYCRHPAEGHLLTLKRGTDARSRRPSLITLLDGNVVIVHAARRYLPAITMWLTKPHIQQRHQPTPPVQHQHLPTPPSRHMVGCPCRWWPRGQFSSEGCVSARGISNPCFQARNDDVFLAIIVLYLCKNYVPLNSCTSFASLALVQLYMVSAFHNLRAALLNLFN